MLQHLEPSINQPADWDFAIGHYLGVDHVGHTYDIHSPHMAAKLHQMNEHVAQVRCGQLHTLLTPPSYLLFAAIFVQHSCTLSTINDCLLSTHVLSKGYLCSEVMLRQLCVPRISVTCGSIACLSAACSVWHRLWRCW